MGLFPVDHVVSGERNNVRPLGKLNLKHHHRAKAEADLAQNEIEFPTYDRTVRHKVPQRADGLP